MISLMEATASRSMMHSVQLILPKGESTSKEKVMRNQTTKIAHVVKLYGHCLRDLEIACWEFREPAALAIRELRNLRRLSIRLDHPHTRYGGLQPSFWDEAEGSTVWNLLAGGKGKGGEEAPLGRLRVLELERAGVTDYQFGKILEGNLGLREVRLRKCLGLTDKAFKILAESAVGAELETFHFTRSEVAKIDGRVLVWVGKMKDLQVRVVNFIYCDSCSYSKVLKALADHYLCEVAEFAWVLQHRLRASEENE